jgi:hypothetical protein
MNYILYTVAVILFLAFVYFSVMNFAVFLNNHFFKKKWVSAIPLIGGSLVR